MDVGSMEGLGVVPTNKAKVFAYIDPDLKEELERLAERRNRSVSNLVETLIREEVEQAKKTGEIPDSVGK